MNLNELESRLLSLQNKTIKIKAEGNYPKGTPVQDVAVYQNNGTERITPARFVESAIKEHRNWTRPISEAVSRYLMGDDSALEQLGFEIAYDINVAVNRIRTGRLKKSFRPEVT